VCRVSCASKEKRQTEGRERERERETCGGMQKEAA